VALRPKPAPSINEDLLRTPIESAPRKPDDLFLWTVFLLLLVAFSMACWIGSYLVFSRPELPLSYKILRKIKKIDLPERFKINAAPQGEFLTATKIFQRYNALSAPELRDLNSRLERSYLRNYPPSTDLIPYVTGRFTILDTYELTPADFVSSGVVALAESVDEPKLLLEHIYSASPTVAPIIKRNLQTGVGIELRRTFELTAVLHVAKLSDGRLQLTVVPLNYGSYLFKGSNGGFSLEPPTALNVAAGWPMVRDQRREEATKAYADYRAQSGLGMFVAQSKAESHAPEPALKGVDVPVEASPTPSATPVPAAVIAKATPPLKAGKQPKKPAAATPTPALVALAPPPPPRAIPVDTPERPAPSVPVVLKAAPAGPGESSGVSLQPFLASGPPAAAGPAAARGHSWPMYAAGRQPGGKNVHVDEIAATSQESGWGGQPVYLSGDFVVSAIGENRAQGIKNAVLRSGSDKKVRVIVEYPADRPLPAEGSDISRDEQHPFQIIDVRQVADGTLNVFAREIMAP
jgi:hypothetical protein